MKNTRPSSMAVVEYPCKDCKDRCVGCHQSCPKYLAAKDHDAEVKQKIGVIEKAEDDYYTYLILWAGSTVGVVTWGLVSKYLF